MVAGHRVSHPQIIYSPSSFWRVVFAFRGSVIPMVMPRIAVLTAISLAAALMNQFQTDLEENVLFDNKPLFEIPAAVLTSFGIFTSLLVSFRVNAAFAKWSLATSEISKMHADTRSLMSSLIMLFPNEHAALINVRRLLVLGCVSIVKHARRRR